MYCDFSFLNLIHCINHPENQTTMLFYRILNYTAAASFITQAYRMVASLFCLQFTSIKLLNVTDKKVPSAVTTPTQLLDHATLHVKLGCT